MITQDQYENCMAAFAEIVTANPTVEGVACREFLGSVWAELKKMREVAKLDSQVQRNHKQVIEDLERQLAEANARWQHDKNVTPEIETCPGCRYLHTQYRELQTELAEAQEQLAKSRHQCDQLLQEMDSLAGRTWGEGEK